MKYFHKVLQGQGGELSLQALNEKCDLRNVDLDREVTIWLLLRGLLAKDF